MTNKEFISKIKSLKSKAIVDDKFFDSNKKEFLNFVSAEFETETKKTPSFKLNGFKLPWMIIGTSLCGVSALGLTVSCALKSIPGDPLYAFKLSMEDVKAVVNISEKNNISLQMEFTNNRIDELSKVLKSDRPDKKEVAARLINEINNNIDNLPEKVEILNNKNKKFIGSTGKDIDNKITEYSDKLIESKNIAANYGVDISKSIDMAYIKGNLMAVKTLNMVVQNSDISDENEKKDIIDRVEKRVDNINNMVGIATVDFVNSDKNDIINESNKNIDSDSSAGELENGGAIDLATQLQNIKEELKKAKIEIASVNMADMMNAISDSLNNSVISTTSISIPLEEDKSDEDIDTEENKEIKEDTKDSKTDININKENKVLPKIEDKDDELGKEEDDVTIQTIDSKSDKDDKVENENMDFQIQSLWNEVDE